MPLGHPFTVFHREVRKMAVSVYSFVNSSQQRERERAMEAQPLTKNGKK